MNIVKRKRLFLSPAVVLLTVSAGFASDDNPRKIWLLAGQSNMLGYTTNTSELPPELQEPQPNVDYFDGKTWQTVRPNMLAGLAFGPELTFGRDLASALPEVNVLLVKCQAGLGDLYNDWRSPNTGRGPAGPHYKAFMELAKNAVASKPGAEIAGMVWMQGEGDAYDDLTEAQSYQKNLELLIQSIRTDLKTPNMAFVIGQISESQQWVHREIVRQAQAMVAQTVPRTAMVVTGDLPLSDGMHYTSNGQMELGSRFARQAILLAAPAIGQQEPATYTPSEDGPGFVSLFDGKTLDGWTAADMSWWSVEDGAITAKITEQKPCTKNQYLFSDVGEMKDFELKLAHRIISPHNVNCGFQFRSEHYQDADCKGYQVDNNTGTPWLVRLYDEFGRHTLAWRGERAVFDENGNRTVTDIAKAKGKPHFDLAQWHEYHLICRGTKITLHVDGRLVAEAIDNDPKQHDLAGLLAMQLHSGPPMTVQFKDIRYKPLP